MNYLILELHGGLECAAIVTDPEGNNRIFDDREDAQAVADDCQNALIIEI